MDNYPSPIFLFLCGMMVMLYLDSGSPQNLYQSMQKYVVIGLVNIYCSNMSYKIISNSICIIFLSIMCMVSFKEEIITNPPFQFQGHCWLY